MLPSRAEIDQAQTLVLEARAVLGRDDVSEMKSRLPELFRDVIRLTGLSQFLAAGPGQKPNPEDLVARMAAIVTLADYRWVVTKLGAFSETNLSTAELKLRANAFTPAATLLRPHVVINDDEGFES